MKGIVVLGRTREDIEQGRQFYDLREPGVGDYLVASLYKDITSLSTLNKFHPKRHGFHRLLASHFPFGIYYPSENNDIYVVAAIDLRRRPSSIRREMKRGGVA